MDCHIQSKKYLTGPLYDFHSTRQPSGRAPEYDDGSFFSVKRMTVVPVLRLRKRCQMCGLLQQGPWEEKKMKLTSFILMADFQRLTF